MSEAAWGSAPPWSLGVEEELLLLDRETLAPGLGAREIVSGREPRLKTELFECLVETTTEVCADSGEVLEQLRALRRDVAERAAAHGLVVAAAGTHPFAVPEEQAIVPEPRYVAMVEELGDVARAQLVCGLHVHVSMPDAETCLRALEGLLPTLPRLLSAAANSPYVAGDETGALSSRAAVLLRLPYAGAPPHFATWDEWERYVEGTGRDYTRLWWDIRPHPRLGTLEVRVPDQPTDVRRSAQLAGMIQELARSAAEREHEPHDRDSYARERERAARERGSERSEADWQLEYGREHGLQALCAALVERSVA